MLELLYRLRGLLPAPEVPQVPVAATAPPPRWLLFTATGSSAVLSGLASSRVRLHGAWMPLPPTSVALMFATRWTEPPQRGSNSVAPGDEVQNGLLTVLPGSGWGTGSDDGDSDW